MVRQAAPSVRAMNCSTNVGLETISPGEKSRGFFQGRPIQYLPASFPCQQDARGNVPSRQAVVEVEVDPAAGGVGEAKGAGSHQAISLDPGPDAGGKLEQDLGLIEVVTQIEAQDCSSMSCRSETRISGRSERLRVPPEPRRARHALGHM